MVLDRNSDLVHAILENLRENDGPLGSGALHYRLRRQGKTISAPTIGRRLQDLEEEGLVEKVKLEGRVLTPSGEVFLRQLQQEKLIESSGEDVLKVLKKGGRQDLIQVLEARRVVEGETVALAAIKAPERIIRRLEKLLANQRKLIEQGELGIDQDIGFHDTIAQACGNKVLASIVRLLRSQNRLNYAVAAIRARVGTQFVVEHEAILKAIRERNADRARQAMERHLSRLIADVNRYWRQMAKQWTRSAGAGVGSYAPSR